MSVYRTEESETIPTLSDLHSDTYTGRFGFSDEPYQPTRTDLDEMEEAFDGFAFDRIIDRLWVEANTEADKYGAGMEGENRRRFVESWINESLKMRAQDAVERRQAMPCPF